MIVLSRIPYYPVVTHMPKERKTVAVLRDEIRALEARLHGRKRGMPKAGK